MRSFESETPFPLSERSLQRAKLISGPVARLRPRTQLENPKLVVIRSQIDPHTQRYQLPYRSYITNIHLSIYGIHIYLYNLVVSGATDLAPLCGRSVDLSSNDINIADISQVAQIETPFGCHCDRPARHAQWDFASRTILFWMMVFLRRRFC